MGFEAMKPEEEEECSLFYLNSFHSTFSLQEHEDDGNNNNICIKATQHSHFYESAGLCRMENKGLKRNPQESFPSM